MVSVVFNWMKSLLSISIPLRIISSFFCFVYLLCGRIFERFLDHVWEDMGGQLGPKIGPRGAKMGPRVPSRAPK